MGKNDSTDKKANSDKQKLKALGRFIQERMKEYKKAWPLGFDCFFEGVSKYDLSLLDSDPWPIKKENEALYIKKLRKATKKLINRYSKEYVRYKFYEDNYCKLFMDKLGNLGDKPEDFFEEEILYFEIMRYGLHERYELLEKYRKGLIDYKVLKKTKTPWMEKTAGELIPKLNNLSSRVWRSLRSYIDESEKTDALDLPLEFLNDGGLAPGLLDKLDLLKFLDTSYDSYNPLFVHVELKAKLGIPFKKLSEKEREAIGLIYDKGYSETKAARHLGITRQSIHERHNRALKKLKKIPSE